MIVKVLSDVYVAPNVKMVVPAVWHAQTVHSHRPIELVAALDGPIEMRIEGGQTISSDSFLVPPMRPHALQRYGGRIVRLYLDAGYRSVAAWKHSPIVTQFESKDDLFRSLAPLCVAGEIHGIAFETMRLWIETWVKPSERDEPSDPRVAEVMHHLDGQGASLSADRNGMANLVGLSPSRFGAIFAEDTGASLSRYLIWRRVKIALSLICAGESVTAAAAAAGFSDGAHLTRSCRATYGFTPSGVTDVRLHFENDDKPNIVKNCLASHPVIARTKK